MLQYNNKQWEGVNYSWPLLLQLAEVNPQEAAKDPILDLVSASVGQLQL